MNARSTGPQLRTDGAIRIGTRGSPLALAQAREVAERLAAAHGFSLDRFETVVIRTSGDRIQDRPLAEAGGKGLFTKEIEEALLEGSIDLAVHSMKDMPTVLPARLEIAAILPREDVRDAFVSLRWPTLDDLPPQARVGTSSLRRAAQILRRRPDLVIVPLRGNVGTRLRKLADGEADATLLAMAGLNRLGMSDRARAPISTDVLLPAVAQGAIGIETRSEDSVTRNLVAAISDPASATAVSAERAFLARLEGSCRTPIAGLGRVSSGRFAFEGEILSPDGTVAHVAKREGLAADADRIAVAAAEDLLERAGTASIGEAR
jgi:hydroxymethylbilane synthase